MHQGALCAPHTVLALLSLEAAIEFFPSVVTQPQVLQHDSVCSGSQVDGIQRCVVRGRCIPGRLFVGTL